MNTIKVAIFLVKLVVFAWIMDLYSDSRIWNTISAISLCVIVILVSFQIILSAAKFQDKSFPNRIIKTFYSESLFPAFVCTLIISSIVYFANSRDFYFVQSEDLIRDEKYEIIPPSDHLIESGEEYPIHVMVKKPLNLNRDVKKPFIACFLFFSLLPYSKKEKG